MSQTKAVRWALGIVMIAMLSVALAACQAEQGPPGPEGPSGPPGPQGPAGPAGEAASTSLPTYVGSEACATCHEDTYNSFILTGHPYKLNAVVDGQPPEYPFSQVPEPPEGYEWSDILYVIGGYGWKARFIDQNGYIITGANAEATTQYNLANDDLDLGPNWSGYHAGEANLPYDCGSCHTTGYSPAGNQNDLPGLVGTWALDGVQCEACHGPASLHVSNPADPNLRPTVTRDAELCGQCHIRGDVSQIDASGAFVQHHEQYEDFYQSQHRALTCVDCHNPHAPTRFRDEAENQGAPSGIVTECRDCHWEQATFVPLSPSGRPHSAPQCIDCHMAPLGKSALGDADRFRGDVASHLFAVNPFTLTQFYTVDDKLYSEGYITVPYACSKCHYEGGLPVPVEELLTFAQGYHNRDRAGEIEIPTPAP
jgi:hypothetical protein